MSSEVINIVVNVVFPVLYLVAMYFIHKEMKEHNPRLDDLILKIEKIIETQVEDNGVDKQ